MANRTKLGRYTPVKDTCHAVAVMNADGVVLCELLLYGLDDRDLYLCPNPYVSEALNRRGWKPGIVNVSPFFVERIR